MYIFYRRRLLELEGSLEVIEFCFFIGSMKKLGCGEGEGRVYSGFLRWMFFWVSRIDFFVVFCVVFLKVWIEVL